LFCFHQKKSAADAHRVICEMYSENVIATLERVRIGLNDLKTVISISVIKTSGSCRKRGIAERWKELLKWKIL